MTIAYPEQDVEVLLPRRYQEEIFTRAQDRNVIAALDTGSGKTFISTLLIKWIAARDTSLGKIIVFLVPKVALVEQQGDFIAKETPLRVSKCYGATAIDMTDRSGWRKEIEEHDVLVMTGTSSARLSVPPFIHTKSCLIQPRYSSIFSHILIGLWIRYVRGSGYYDCPALRFMMVSVWRRLQSSLSSLL